MATVVATARVIAGAVPSALIVIAVFLFATLALLLGEERREWALRIVDRMLKLAKVLVGFSPTAAPQVTDRTEDKGSTQPKRKVGHHL